MRALGSILCLLSTIGLAVAQETPVCIGDQTRATVDRVIDGDTVVVKDAILSVVVGNFTVRVTGSGSVRLLQIDAPELDAEGGQAAKDFLTRLLPKESSICMRMTKNDSFGRPLVFIQAIPPETRTVNEIMVAEGHAVRRR